MEEAVDPPTQVLIGPQALEGDLVLPPRAEAIIVFAHGSGSGRRSSRNLQVAHALNEQRLGTLLFDLLRPEEALDRGNVFDIELLGRRVTDAIEWLDRTPLLAALPLGLFGASTGAAAALVAAAARPERVFDGPKRTRHRAGGNPPVRRARRPRARDGTGRELVHRSPAGQQVIMSGWDLALPSACWQRPQESARDRPPAGRRCRRHARGRRRRTGCTAHQRPTATRAARAR